MSFSKTDMVQTFGLMADHLPEFCYKQVLSTRLIQLSADHCSSHQNKCLREFGINENLWLALSIIFVSPRKEILPSRLSDLMNLTRTSATRLADEMVSRDWIERKINEHDRRQIVLRLTHKGETFVRTVQPIIAKKQREMWADFSDDEYQTLQKMLSKVLK